jgi:hypothetical protein
MPRGTGIYTSYPSPTPVGLGLGPTDPGRINLPQETLGFRRTSFITRLTLLIPAFSLLRARPVLTVWLPRTQNAPLPSEQPQSLTSAASVLGLSPVGLSAQDHSTSELLRTL